MNQKESQSQFDGQEFQSRAVLYPDVRVEVCAGRYINSAREGYRGPMNSEFCKEILGWTEDQELARSRGLIQPLLTDKNNHPVWCLNNLANRPLYLGQLETLIQEHLRQRWRFNGEDIIIGTTGTVLNGQHSLLSVPLAEQIRLIDLQGEGVWKELWPEEVTMEKVIIYGIEESDDVVNTMDTAKPRSLADVIYRSEYFRGQKMVEKDVRALSKITEVAIRLLWFRTGAVNDAFTPRRTHSESIDWLNRHRRLVQAAHHIYRDFKANFHVNMKIINPGYAAALLYLMAACATDGAMYREQDPPVEHVLDLSYWDRSCSFWSLLLSSKPELKEVRKQIALLGSRAATPGSPPGGSEATVDEKLAVIVKAWNIFRQDKTPTRAQLKLNYDKDQDGYHFLRDCPDVGGIDLGDPGDPGTQSQIEEEQSARRAKQEDQKLEETERHRKVEDVKSRRRSSRNAP